MHGSHHQHPGKTGCSKGHLGIWNVLAVPSAIFIAEIQQLIEVSSILSSFIAHLLALVYMAYRLSKIPVFDLHHVYYSTGHLSILLLILKLVPPAYKLLIRNSRLYINEELVGRHSMLLPLTDTLGLITGTVYVLTEIRAHGDFRGYYHHVGVHGAFLELSLVVVPLLRLIWSRLKKPEEWKLPKTSTQVACTTAFLLEEGIELGLVLARIFKLIDSRVYAIGLLFELLEEGLELLVMTYRVLFARNLQFNNYVLLNAFILAGCHIARGELLLTNRVSVIGSIAERAYVSLFRQLIYDWFDNHRAALKESFLIFLS